ncbi:MAG: winged helix-turn-helix domain-containing protein [Parvularculaceae bacterium]
MSAGSLAIDPDDERAFLNGEPVKLGPKSFALLKALMTSPERLITKEELIEKVWDGRAVSDAVLTTAMRELRRAIGDDAREPAFIETVHGRGYRFLKPVSVDGAASATSPSRAIEGDAGVRSALSARYALPAIAITLAVGFFIFWLLIDRTAQKTAEINPASIAVLPFDDLSAEKDQAYFSDGLTEEILNVLARVDGLAVASRTSAFAYSAGDRPSIRQIAQALQVRHILEGSVRKAGDRVRITAQLIDANTDAHLWSETYDRELTVKDLFSVQEDIATKIVAELEHEIGDALGDGAPLLASAAAGTTNLSAYDSYLRGRELFIARRNLGDALDFARHSVEADPAFARGWELVAGAAFVRSGDPSAEAQNAVATALQLDDNLSLAHALKGVMGNIHPPYDWSAAVGELERAVSLDPKNTTALLWLGVELRKLGYLDRAEVLFSRCLEIDPNYHRCRLHRMWTEHMKRETDAAFKDYDALVENGTPPDDAVLLFAAQRRNDVALITTILNSLSSQTPLPKSVVTALKNPRQNQAAAGKALEQWLASEKFNRRDVYPIIYAFGRYDLIPVSQGSFFGLWLPEFADYRQSDHFRNFISTMRIDAYWREHGFPPQCRPVGAEDFAC